MLLLSIIDLVGTSRYKNIQGATTIMQKNKQIPSRSFRLVCAKEHISLVEGLLHVEGFAFEPEPFSPWCRILTAEPKPLGSSLAAFFGLIYIQDRSSMLPPLALAGNFTGDEGLAVLDMCASPGSKTGFLGQLVGKDDFVLGNEPSKSRLATLRANMAQLGFLHVATCTYGGEDLALNPNSWQYIQLDPPCSGWGTVAKNPQVLDLWQGKKISPLIQLQRMLLKKAYELLRPGGQVVYSTCTTNVDENENQVKYAMNELGFELVSIEPFDGFTWEDTPLTGTLRVDGARSDAQGFYIAKLQKPHSVEVNNIIKSVALNDEELNKNLLEGPCTDINLLPKGSIMLFGNVARFVPHAALNVLNENLRWQASPLGKMMGDCIRLAPHCTSLMPSVAPKDALVLDDIKDIYALLQGQSLKTDLKGRETGLYYQAPQGTLPLGRITLKQGRALWSGR